jgi:hypothetical protein
MLLTRTLSTNLKVKVRRIFYGVVHVEWMYGAWEEKKIQKSNFCGSDFLPEAEAEAKAEAEAEEMFHQCYKEKFELFCGDLTKNLVSKKNDSRHKWGW